MKQHAKRTNLAFITISGLMLSSQAYSVETPIYKWQDHRGITQYSDRAPTVAYTKASRFEMINAMQAKDLCAVPASSSSVFLAKSNVATTATPSYSANLINVIDNRLAVAALNAKVRAVSLAKAAIAASNKAIAAAKAAASGSTGQSSNSLQAAAKAAAQAAAAAQSLATQAAAKAAQAAAQSLATQAAAKGETAAGLLKSKTPTTLATNTQNTSTQASTATLPKLVVNADVTQRGLMPAVDTSKNMTPYLGYAEQRIRASKSKPTVNPNADRFSGEFRIVCKISHMSNDDPILYPNQKGAAHHHTFYGNSSVDHKSNLMTLDSVGSGSCTGGTANRSAYWAPSMINTVTHEPIAPYFTIVYYKVGRVISEMVQAPPKGLRMITGNMKAKTQAEGQVQYSCLPPYGDGIPDSQQYVAPKSYIQACPAGWSATVAISFPQCWDGKNLDSPDHISHMANSNRLLTTPNLCPESHPIAIPQITINQRYNVPQGADMSKWRLSSDNYSADLPGGYSGHADWVNGWTPEVMNSIIKNCLNAKVDCGASLLGDGREIY